MKILIQKVTTASVIIDNKTYSKISKGLLVFLGVEVNDTELQADFLVNKLINLRIFEDENNKMNLSVKDVKGEILVVSQFTLAADTTHGNRPGFSLAEKPERANFLYEYFNKSLTKSGIIPQTGVFQADMKVELLNDGPCTFLITK